jgi:hypothetical protein
MSAIHLAIFIWKLTLSGCVVFEDFSANCYGFIWAVPW